MVLDAEQAVYAFVGSVDFCNTGAVCSLFLSDGLPGNGPSRAADEIPGERSILEGGKGGAVRYGVTKLSAPTGIAESCEVET